MNPFLLPPRPLSLGLRPGAAEPPGALEKLDFRPGEIELELSCVPPGGLGGWLAAARERADVLTLSVPALSPPPPGCGGAVAVDRLRLGLGPGEDAETAAAPWREMFPGAQVQTRPSPRPGARRPLPEPPPTRDEGGLRRRLRALAAPEIPPEEVLPGPAVPGEGPERRDCLFPWDWAFVSGSGRVGPCPVSPRELGDLGRESFAEVWAGDRYREFRERLLGAYPFPECRRCRLRPRVRVPSRVSWAWAGINDVFGVQTGPGWFPPEGRPYRWSRAAATLLLAGAGEEKLTLVLTLPSRRLAQSGRVRAGGAEVGTFALSRAGDRRLEFAIPPAEPATAVEIVCDREIVPAEVLGNDDRRRLGAAWKGAALG
ncbi:MAG TPA: SPASM domain-containing protein [bacterium]|nr:SPASM domain-containing protein [bacterium]HPQ67117.1 SPASM domain-containing protein [bacterium]